MVDICTDIIIDAPIEVVRKYAANPDNAPLWYVNIKSVEWQTPRPLDIGSKIDFVAHFAGRKLAYTYEIIEWSDTRMVMRTAQGPFPMETSYTWEKLTEFSTRMTLRNKGYPKGFMRIFRPFLSLMMRNANKKDLMLLKHIVEQANQT